MVKRALIRALIFLTWRQLKYRGGLTWEFMDATFIKTIPVSVLGYLEQRASIFQEKIS